MRVILDQAELRQCFREIDRENLDCDALRFPLAFDGALTWANGPRAYLLFRDHDDGPVKGVVFHRDNSATPEHATMCQWCHRVRGHGGVKMLSVRSSRRRWVGQYLCTELDCLDASRAPGIDDLRETIDAEARKSRTLDRMRTFASRYVF